MFKLLRFGIKAGIATSAVYLTVDNGVWKDSETTSKLYEQLSKQVNEYAGPYLEKVPLPDIPHTGSLVGTVESAWNSGVKSSCKFIVASPTCAKGYIKQGYQYLEEQIKAASQPPS